MSHKKIGVLLAGCGFMDGAEIRESVFTLLALDKIKMQFGIETLVMAPNINQHHVINHLTGQEVAETRNVLIESARIARGKIVDMETVDPQELAGLILPGGFGVAKNLCQFAFQGSEATIDPIVKDFVEKAYLYNIPIGAICISPALIALLFGKDGVEVTIGNDNQTAEEIEKTGAKHLKTSVSEIHVDEQKKIVTTAAYMFDEAPLDQVYEGIEKLVRKVVELA